MPKYLQMSWYVSLERAPNIFKRALVRANCKECLTAEFTGHEIDVDRGARVNRSTAPHAAGLAPATAHAEQRRRRIEIKQIVAW